jgi:hypothetical protein
MEHSLILLLYCSFLCYSSYPWILFNGQESEPFVIGISVLQFKIQLLKRGSVVTFTELWVSLRVTVAATRGAGFGYHFVAPGSSPDFDSMFYVCSLWFCSLCLFPHFFAHVFVCLYWFATFFLSHLGIFCLSFVLYIAVLHLCHWDFFWSITSTSDERNVFHINH